MRSLLPRLITSPQLRTLQRRTAATWRWLRGSRPTVRFFHQVDDAHSTLAVRALSHLESSYGVRVEPWLVPPPSAAAAPDQARLSVWAPQDAALLARGVGLSPTWSRAPDPVACVQAHAALAAASGAQAFAEACAAVEASWLQEHPPRQPVPMSDALGREAVARGATVRRRLGHYLGGMFEFEGEWYWGLDRLGHLENRLAPLNPEAAPFVPRREVTLRPAAVPSTTVLEAFVSLRSPYTYIAIPRLSALALATGATLSIRPVLPMVMRGLPVPLAKRLYIIRDTRREAERLGIPFGAINDPVGAPAERGLAVLVAACAAGRGEAFLLSFLQGVFADGVSAGSQAGLMLLGERAGLDAAFIRAALADPGWRAVTETNRADMLAAGLWGVPAFRVVADGVAGPAYWGQDRLWAVEEELQALAGARA